MATSFKLKLHRNQAKVFNSKAIIKLVIAGRRFGKSRLLLSKVIHSALAFNQPIDPASPPVCLIAMPTLKAAKAIHWQPLLNLLEKQPFVESISKTDYRIKLKGNKPDILVRGADNGGDSLRGLKIYFAGLDEFQDFDYSAWDNVIYPALGDTPNSEALIIGTPKGKSHWLHKFHLEVKKNKGWEYFHFITADNPFFPKSKLKRAKETLPPKVYRQEMEASFEDFDGQIYTEFTEENQLASIPTNFVHTFLGIDWGDINPALTVIGLTPEGRYYLIDKWTNPVKGNPVLFDTLVDKAIEFCHKYRVSRSFADPSRPSNILDLQKIGKKKGVPGLAKTIAGFNRVSEGNQIINGLFYQGRYFINSKLTDTVSNYLSYHRIGKDGVVIDKVEDGQEDHDLDSARYVLASLEQRNNIK